MKRQSSDPALFPVGEELWRAPGGRTDSPGIRCDVTQRADHTEERSSATVGGFEGADFARCVDAAGDVTAAARQWLVGTGRIRSYELVTGSW